MKNLILIVSILIGIQTLIAQTGIGTNAPTNKLDIFTLKADPATTGSSANGNLRLGSTASTPVLDFGLSGTSTYSWIQARDKSNYGTNYSLTLNPNGGNVGINKSIPTKALDVTGDIGLSGNLVGANVATSTIAGFAANFNAQTNTTYTLASSDNGKIITLNNASAITLNVPSLFAGFNCMIIQLGLGQVTLTPSGTTISNRSNYTKTGGTNAIVTIVATAAASFISGGDMSN